MYLRDIEVMTRMVEERVEKMIKPLQKTLNKIKTTVNSIHSTPSQSSPTPTPYQTALLANPLQTGRNPHPAPTVLDE
jgi:hypothetical protein